jgi:prepilin-type processing-associated H-X9-DG protein/prepilin-type N-terminal cleavage/methylation domain-containing protein
MKTKRPIRSTPQAGFSLIELLVIVVIIGILATMCMTAVSKVREKGQLTVCASNLRQIMGATLTYINDNNGKMPLVYQNEVGDGSRWAVQILGYLGDTSPRIDEGDSVFRCPADNVVRTESIVSTPCSYGLNVYVHVNGIASNTTRKYFAIIPDPAKTIFYGEVWSGANTVLHSLSTGAGEQFLGNYHDGKGSNYAFADGHVEFLSKDEVRANGSELMTGIPVR